MRAELGVDRRDDEGCAVGEGDSVGSPRFDKRPGPLARRLALLLGTTATLALSPGQPAHAVSLNDPAAAAAGGIQNYYDAGNQFPNTASLFSSGNSFCTGSLINSRTVLTAAHCFYDQFGQWDGGPTPGNPNLPIPSASFAPIAGPGDPNFRTVSSIFVHRSYNQSTADDIAVITLANPVTAIAPVRLMTAATPTPAPGTTVVFAGYGGYGIGSNCCSATDNKRRVGNAEFGAYRADNEDTDQPFLYAQFRNPLSPNNPNAFNLTAPTSPIEAGTVPGDSGGPLWIQTPSGLVQIGVLRGGDNPVGRLSEYGDISDWTPLNLFLDWLALNNPLRQVTAATGNFNWSNQAAWIDSVPEVESGVPNNTEGNVADYQTDVAHYYDVTLRNAGTITLDMDPTIDTLSIAGAQSTLVIGAPYTLNVLLSTTLSAGTLRMAGGTLISPEVLISGGLLTGNGVISAAGGTTGVCAGGVCNTGGIVAPVGTLTIAQGNYTQTGGMLQVQLTPAGSNSRLAVADGTAFLGGTLGALLQPGLYARSTVYSGVVTADAVSGEFAQTVAAAPPSGFFSVAATYNAESVDLTLTRTPFGALAGLSGNQRAVGNALEGAYATTLTGAAAALYTDVLFAPSAAGALSQLSGENNAGGGRHAAFQMMNEFLLLMLNPFGEDRGGFAAADAGLPGAASRFAPERVLPPETALAYAAVTRPARPAAFAERWNAWASAYGGLSNAHGDANVGSHDFAARTAGFATGLDYRLSPDTMVGFALAGGNTSWQLAQGLGGGRSDVFQAGLYGSQRFGAAYLSGALAFANHWMTTSRTVIVSQTNQLSASFNAQSWAGRIEGGYRLGFSPFTLAPYAALQAQSFSTPTYGESASFGSSLFGLSYASRTGSVLRAELGSWINTSVALAGGAALNVFGRAGWAHDWQDTPQAAATFLTLPTASFIVAGAEPAPDLAVVTAGSELRLANSVSVMAKFDGEFGRGTRTYAGTARVRYVW